MRLESCHRTGEWNKKQISGIPIPNPPRPCQRRAGAHKEKVTLYGLVEQKPGAAGSGEVP